MVLQVAPEVQWGFYSHLNLHKHTPGTLLFLILFRWTRWLGGKTDPMLTDPSRQFWKGAALPTLL